MMLPAVPSASLSALTRPNLLGGQHAEREDPFAPGLTHNRQAPVLPGLQLRRKGVLIGRKRPRLVLPGHAPPVQQDRQRFVASHDEPGLARAVRVDRGIGQTAHPFVRPQGVPQVHNAAGGQVPIPDQLMPKGQTETPAVLRPRNALRRVGQDLGEGRDVGRHRPRHQPLPNVLAVRCSSPGTHRAGQ